MKLYSPPNNGFPQELPDRWRFDNGEVYTNLKSLTDHELSLLDWIGPIKYPVAKQVDDQGNLITPEWDYDPETHKPVWYKYYRRFIIVDKNIDDMPYLDGKIVEPLVKPDWTTFQRTAVASVSLNQYIAQMIPYAPLAAVAVPSILRDAIAKGDYGDFVTVWNTLKSIMPPSQQLITEITTLASSLNLPREFIDIFVIQEP
jgi:hypothetical protein